MENKKEIVIIGSGVAGLSAGIFCLKEGFKVTIIEKNDYSGGKNGNFSQHPLLKMYPKEIIGSSNEYETNRLFDDLDIKVAFKNNDILYLYKEKDRELNIYKDITKLFNELLEYSEGDESRIIDLINLIKQGSLYYINSEKPEEMYRFFEYGKQKKKNNVNDKIIKKYQKITIKEYFESFNSAIIKGAFTNILPSYCSVSSLICYLGYLTNDNIKYINNDLNDELYRKYIELGGKLLFKKEAKEIAFDRLNYVSSIVLNDETKVTGDYFISAVDPIFTYNTLLKKKYSDRKLFLKINNHFDYSLNRKFIVCFLMNEELNINDIILKANEFGFNTQRFDCLNFKTNGKYLFCILNQNKNDYDYLKIILDKPMVFKKICGDLVDLIINTFKLNFPKTKISFVDVITPIDLEKEYLCYEGYTSGFLDTPKGINFMCDLNVASINNLFLASSLLSQNGGITNAMINGKFSVLKMIRMIKNEKEKNN